MASVRISMLHENFIDIAAKDARFHSKICTGDERTKEHNDNGHTGNIVKARKEKKPTSETNEAMAEKGKNGRDREAKICMALTFSFDSLCRHCCSFFSFIIVAYLLLP